MNDKKEKNDKVEKAQSRRYDAGSVLFREGDPFEALLILQRGQVKIEERALDGRQIPIAIINAGEFLGELALFSTEVHSTTAIALSDIEVIELSKSAIAQQLQQLPPWLNAMMKGLADKLHHANDVLRRNQTVDSSLQNAISSVGGKKRR